MNNSGGESRVDDLLDRFHEISAPQLPAMGTRTRPNMNFDFQTTNTRRPMNLSFTTTPSNMQLDKNDEKLQEIMKNSGKLKICDITYKTQIADMKHIEELGNGTCGHVVKMKHLPSDKTIAVKQMRRTGDNEENKRIVMDIEVVIKSHDCPYIVQCLGCFITDSEVWICMELMATCFDKLLKRVKQPIPEHVLGKVTVATVKALAYLKDTHGIIHRDVKPSNILLDEKGNVKLCDFGISGRLVDSMAATRSVGCTAYLAPERITIDHKNQQDYDVRADVWSLGITLVELATGVFPYKDCSTEFEVLTKVVDQDPPSLPSDKEFSPEFRRFVDCCLIKDQKKRPKYVKLQEEPFIAKHETSQVNVGEWFMETVRQVEGGGIVVPIIEPLSPRQKHASFVYRHHQRQLSEPPPQTTPPIQLTNGRGGGGALVAPKISELPPDGRGGHVSRISTFQMQQVKTATYNPFQAYKNHIIAKSNGESANNVVIKQRHYSPLPQRHITVTDQSPLLQRRGDCNVTSPYMQRKDRWNSPVGSPLPLRNHIQPDEPRELPYNCGNTSPIVLQRFYHQQKQQKQAKDAEDQQTTTKPDTISGRQRSTSYIKLQLNSSDGRTSRHQSPEPPPRLSRRAEDSQSPLAVRRHFFESNALASPILSRRYISPAPPVPPPRRLSESISVPGSPQHVRARFHYTPEPQRRLFQNNDVS